MTEARTPAQIRQLLKNDRGPIQKIRRKPKLFDPNKDLRNSNKNKYKESYGSEQV